MIIPKHTICNVCKEVIPKRGQKAYKLKYTIFHESYAGYFMERGHDDLCEDCMKKFKKWCRSNKDGLDENKRGRL